MAPASVGVLGPLQVRVDGTLLNLPGERSRRVLGALVDAGADGAAIDRLALVIWDDHDRPAEPTSHVRTAISRLRRTFDGADADGSNLIQSRMGGGYRLGPSVEVDAWSFESELTDPSRSTGSHSQRLSALETILDRWRGDPYVDIADQLAFGPSIARLSDLRLAAEEERLGLLLTNGKNQQVVARASALAQANPWREELHRLHSLALYRNGRQTDALKALRDHAQTARGELGLEPGPALVALETQILNHDPALSQIGGSRESLRGYRVHETLRRSAGRIPALRRRATQELIDASVAIETIDLAAVPASMRVVDVISWVAMRAHLKHPSIEPVLDHWRDPGAIHLVLPLHPHSVQDELAVGTFDLSRIATLAAQIGTAIDMAHADGLVHGQIDSDVVFCGADGSFILGCFPPLTEEKDVSVDIAGLARLVTAVVAGSRSATGDSLARMLPGAAHPAVAAEVLVQARGGLGSTTGAEFATRLIDALGVAMEIAPVVAENPYPGLHSFAESRFEDFHGREAIVEELCNRWIDPEERLLVVAGASGTGKSSVLRAGLIPALRAGAVDRSDRWVFAVMTPGSDPIRSLAEALSAVAVEVHANPAELLRSGVGDGSVDRLGAAVAEAVGADAELVLVIDQFEELFGGTGPRDQHSHDGFLDLIAAALEAPDSRIRVAVSMRTDVLDRALERQPFAALFRRAVVPLAPLNVEELERAIAVPGIDHGFEITPSLRSRLVQDVLAEVGALPLLAVTLRELWSMRSQPGVIDLGDYEKLGGLTGGLIGPAESLIASLDEQGVNELRRLFGRTVIIEPGRPPVRRTATLVDVLSAGVSRATVDAAIDARLLAADRDPMTREPTVVPIHEAVLERWPRLADWLSEDRVRLHEHQRLATAAASWNEDKRDGDLLLRGSRLDQALDLRRDEVALTTVEAHFIEASEIERDGLMERDRMQIRRRRNLTVVACVVAVAALLAGSLAVVQGRRAERAAATAEIRLMTQSASALFDERPALGLHLALGALERGGGPDAEAVLIGLLGRAPFDRQIGTAVESRCMAMSADATRLAVASFAALGDDGHSAITKWDINTGMAAALGSVQMPHWVCPELSPDGQRVAVFDGETLQVAEVRTGNIIASSEPGQPSSVGWTLDGSSLIALFDDDRGRIDVLDGATLLVDLSIRLDTDFVSQVTATARDGLAIVTSDARPPLVVDLDRRSIRELEEAEPLVVTAAVNRAETIVVGRSDTNLVAWEVESGRHLWTTPHGGGDPSLGPVAINTSGTYAATTGTNGVLIVDVQTGRAIAEPLPIATARSVIGFSGDEELVVTGAGDRINVLRVHPRVDILHHDVPVGAVSPDGAVTIPLRDEVEKTIQSILLSPSGERTHLSTGESRAVPIDARTVVGYEEVDRRFVFWVDGERVVDVDLSDRLSADSMSVRTVRIGHGLVVQQFMDPALDTSTITTLVFEAQSGDLIAELKTPDEDLAVAIAHDRLAIADIGFGVRITDLEGNTIQQVARFGHPITEIATASDGDLLIGLGDGTLHRHPLSAAATPQTLVGPPSAVMQILIFDGGFVTAHLSGEVVKWYDGAERPAGTIHGAVGFAGFGAVGVNQDVVLYPEPGQVVRLPLGRDAFVAEACRRAGLEIDRAAWAAITDTDPDVVEDLCRDSLAG